MRAPHPEFFCCRAENNGGGGGGWVAGGGREVVEFWKVEGRPEEVKGNYGICVASRRRLTEGRRMKGWEEAAPRAALVCEREVVPVFAAPFPPSSILSCFLKGTFQCPLIVLFSARPSSPLSHLPDC